MKDKFNNENLDYLLIMEGSSRYMLRFDNKNGKLLEIELTRKELFSMIRTALHSLEISDI